MKNKVSDRLKNVSSRLYEDNDSAMARDLNMSPQNLYRYINGKRDPNYKLLNRLAIKEYSINDKIYQISISWVVAGVGEMLYEKGQLEKLNESAVTYKAKEKKVDRLINLIIQRLNEVEFSEDEKIKLLQDTLNSIAIAQNTYFIENELKK